MSEKPNIPLTTTEILKQITQELREFQTKIGSIHAAERDIARFNLFTEIASRYGLAVDATDDPYVSLSFNNPDINAGQRTRITTALESLFNHSADDEIRHHDDGTISPRLYRSEIIAGLASHS
jgi:hypothetical protein